MSHPTLVLLPGLDGTGDLFGPLLDAIPAAVPTRVIAYPADRPLSYVDLDGFLEEQLRDEREVVLVAESFSGPLALRYASSHPEHVRATVLCASFVRSPLPRWLRPLAKPLLFRIPLPDTALRHLMIGRRAPDALVRAVKQSIRKVSPQVMARRLREVFDVDCSKALHRCPSPLLYLAATRDALVPRSCLDTIRAIRPDVAIRTVDGPHLLLQREPQAAWEQIVQFLNDISACGAKT